MNLETIAGHLADNDCGKLSESLFVTEMPTPCKHGILLLDNYYGTSINHELPNYYVTEFRVVTRSSEYTAGMELAKRASAALTILAETEVEDMLIKKMLPINLPRPYRRSVGGYWEFEVEVSIVFVDLGV